VREREREREGERERERRRERERPECSTLTVKIALAVRRARPVVEALDSHWRAFVSAAPDLAERRYRRSRSITRGKCASLHMTA
jgi:hypothetical protein